MNPLTQHENPMYNNINSVQQQQQDNTLTTKEDYQMVLVQSDPNATYQTHQQLVPMSMQQNYQFHNFVPVEVRTGTYATFDHKPVVRSSSFSGYENYQPQYERGFQFRSSSSNNYLPQNPHPSFSVPNNNNNPPIPSNTVVTMNTVTPTTTTILQQSSSVNSPMSYSSPLETSTPTSRDGSQTPTSPQIKPFESSLLERLSPSRKRSNSDPTTTRSSKLKKKRSCARWTEDENKKLIEAYIKYEGKNWSAIAKTVGNKTSDQCNQHWWRVLNPEICKQPWGNEEDQLLYDRVQEFGESSWKKVSQGLRGRTDLQCRHRWNQLKKLSKKQPGSSNSSLVLDSSSTNEIQEAVNSQLNTSSSELMRVAGYYQMTQPKEEMVPSSTQDGTGSPSRKSQQVTVPEQVVQQGIYQDFYFQQPMVSSQVQYQPNHNNVEYRETVVAEGEVPSMVVYQSQPMQQIQHIQQLQPIQTLQTIQGMQPMQTIQTIQGMQPMQTIHSIQPMQHMQTIQPVGHHQPHTGIYHYSFPVYQQPISTQTYYHTSEVPSFTETQNNDEFFEPGQNNVNNGEENTQVDIDLLEAVLQNQSRIENRDEIFEPTTENRESHYY